MISYAQNCEDVILARLFRGRDTGCYVDVGANDPLIDSVTAHFYQLGWRGINIEPLPAAFAALQAARPQDINLDCAIGDADAQRPFFAAGGLSTTVPALARELATAWDVAKEESTVQTLPLATVLQRHSVGSIDFLKVDVEGAEEMVLASNDWHRFRPAVVLVEAIHPVTHAPTHAQWEGLLLEARYRFVYFDGVNRFYCNTDLAPPPAECFLPPNVLDAFTPYRQVLAAARAEAAEATLAELRAALATLLRAAA